MFNACSVLGFYILGVILHITAIQHRILRSCDINKGRFHSRKNILYLAQIDVPVNLPHIIGRSTHIVLNKAAPFHDSDLGNTITYLYTHHVATYRATISFTTFAPFNDLCIGINGRALLSASCSGLSASTTAALLLGTITVARFLRRLSFRGRRGRTSITDLRTPGWSRGLMVAL
ncbi:unannotated protein [freshwater metagenome]|uniref:Unannotated protein n=1 Tax=freshwater metagenome TaxID=449393 RepID=A0A6J6DZB9_9ZZZZ